MESTSDFLSAKIRTGGGVLVRHSKMQIQINVIYELLKEKSQKLINV